MNADKLTQEIEARAALDGVPLSPEQTSVGCAAAGCSEHHHAKRVFATAKALVATKAERDELLAALIDLLECDVEITGSDAAECAKNARDAVAKASGR